MRLPVIALLLVPFFAVTAPSLSFESAAETESCADAASSAAVRKPNADDRTLLFDQFVQPLVEEATRRRARLATQDPLYANRVDTTIWDAELGIERDRGRTLMGAIAYRDERRRGMWHWDSSLFPYVATALVKGRWNIGEYPELVRLLAEYGVDVSVRGAT